MIGTGMEEHMRQRIRPNGARGFTLIELLVVVMIIGILASIAIPQYFKVVERAKVSEAQNFIVIVRNSAERYYARYGSYPSGAASIVNLDVSFSGASPDYGMKYYSVSGLDACTSGTITSFKLHLTRKSPYPARYGPYQMVFNACDNTVTEESGCATAGICASELL
jgi:prepilin-type N-terminal cleavage/methylation domain-containing protein